MAAVSTLLTTWDVDGIIMENQQDIWAERNYPMCLSQFAVCPESVTTMLKAKLTQMLALLPPQQPRRYQGTKWSPLTAGLSACVASLLRNHVPLPAEGLSFSEQHCHTVNHRAAEKDRTIASSSSQTGLHGEFWDKWTMFSSICNYMTWIRYQLHLFYKWFCQTAYLWYQVDFSQDLCYQQDLRVINLIIALLTKTSDSTILVAGKVKDGYCPTSRLFQWIIQSVMEICKSGLHVEANMTGGPQD